MNKYGKHFSIDINRHGVKYRRKVRRRNQNILLLALLCVIMLKIINFDGILAYLTSFDSKSNSFSINAEYIVTFNKNTGNGSMNNQTISFNESTNLSANTFTKQDYVFNGWNTNPDGTGTYYQDEQSVLNIGNTTLYAQWLLANRVAEIDGTYYSSLQDAINDVPLDGTETTIKLLCDISEHVTVNNGKNIVFNLQNYTVSNINTGAIIENNGTIKIQNGTLYTTSEKTAVINNNSTGKVVVTGGRIIVAPGGRQAIYNNNGIVEISGNAYLKSEGMSGTNQRATVQNLASGTLTITGGTIISTNFHAVNNIGTMTIGTSGGNVSTTSPLIIGGNYGVNSTTNYSFYDGILKGKTSATNGLTKIRNIENGYQIASSEEIIDGNNYNTAYLAITKTVTFNPNGGSVTETTRNIEVGKKIGTLPIPTRVGHVFLGWFTDETNGEQITEERIITDNETFYAHWEEVYVAEIDGVKYYSLQEAINTVHNNSETTIILLRDVQESVTVNKNKIIDFDFQNYTITNSGEACVIKNYGTVSIHNGTLRSNTLKATIDNESGAKLTISGGNIITTGTRQSIYNNGGTVEISGTAYLSSEADGMPDTTVLRRGTIHNYKGTVKITGGTIIGINQYAISNEAKLEIGTSDGNVNVSSPLIQGKINGIINIDTVKYYDGIIKGETDAIDGSITEVETGYEIINGTETIDGITYKTAHLEIIN